jgi:hypothetical protein
MARLGGKAARYQEAVSAAQLDGVTTANPRAWHPLHVASQQFQVSANCRLRISKSFTPRATLTWRACLLWRCCPPMCPDRPSGKLEPQARLGLLTMAGASRLCGGLFCATGTVETCGFDVSSFLDPQCPSWMRRSAVVPLTTRRSLRAVCQTVHRDSPSVRIDAGRMIFY